MPERAREAADTKKFTFVVLCGLFISLFLAVIKFILGALGHSFAVVADGVDSLSDAITDIALLFGIKYWNAPPDSDHPYGHYRIEAIITAFIALSLTLAALIIIYRAFLGFYDGAQFKRVKLIAIYAPILAILLKEGIYRWQISVSRKINSQSLAANAWHHRSDAITSVISLLAVMVSIFVPGFHYADNVGGIICSLLIFRIAYKIIKPALNELSDGTTSEAILSEIERVAINSEGVLSVHKIRTRKMGKYLFADLHMLVNGNTSVKNGHDIAEKLQKELKLKIPALKDIVIHIEPYE